MLWTAAVFLFVSGRRDWRPFPNWPRAYALAIGAFAVIVLSFLATGFGIEWLVLYGIRPILFSNVTSVTVDGKSIANSQTLVSDLRKLPDGSDHHSHPTKMFRVALKTAKGPLVLDLKRDSGDPTEYWVYDPDFRSCYLGKIHTYTLDES